MSACCARGQALRSSRPEAMAGRRTGRRSGRDSKGLASRVASTVAGLTLDPPPFESLRDGFEFRQLYGRHPCIRSLSVVEQLAHERDDLGADTLDVRGDVVAFAGPVEDDCVDAGAHVLGDACRAVSRWPEDEKTVRA